MRQSNEWSPIVSAPRDGRAILAWGPLFVEPQPIRYDAEERRWVISASGALIIDRDAEPTHWIA